MIYNSFLCNAWTLQNSIVSFVIHDRDSYLRKFIHGMRELRSPSKDVKSVVAFVLVCACVLSCSYFIHNSPQSASPRLYIYIYIYVYTRIVFKYKYTIRVYTCTCVPRRRTNSVDSPLEGCGIDSLQFV